MSLASLQNRQTATIFGEDLDVLENDTFINGDLTVDGLVNGISDQGQKENNIWVGTNDWSVNRPQCVPTLDTNPQSAVNLALEQEKLVEFSPCNTGETWSGANTFLQNVVFPNIPTPTPVNVTDGCPAQYVSSQWAIQDETSFLSDNNTWTNSNLWVNTLPTVIEPVNDTDVATKNYVDTETATFTGGNVSTNRSNASIQNQQWGVFTAVEVQIIGAGGGATEANGTCNTCTGAGNAGASGASGSMFVLTNTLAKTVPNGYAGFDITNGNGGDYSGGSCGSSTNGEPTNFYIQPFVASGLNTAEVNVLRANGGGATPKAGCVQFTPVGGTWNSIDARMVRPFGASGGSNGGFCKGPTLMYTGIGNYGWGAGALNCTNSKKGQGGGFGLAFFA